MSPLWSVRMHGSEADDRAGFSRVSLRLSGLRRGVNVQVSGVGRGGGHGRDKQRTRW